MTGDAFLLFDPEVEALEIVVELIGGVIRFVRPLDDAEMDELGVLGGHAGELKEAEADAFEKSLLTAVIEIALLDD